MSDVDICSVIKRDCIVVDFSRDKLLARVSKMTYGLNTDYVNVTRVVDAVSKRISDRITMVQLDSLVSEVAARLATSHPDYSILAGRIAVSCLHKQTQKKFSSVVEELHRHVPTKRDRRSSLISKAFYDNVQENAAILDSAILYSRDFDLTYFSFKTLERSYLLSVEGRIVERPQHMIMRVAVQIHGIDLPRILSTYELMSSQYFTHASSTMSAAGTPFPQLSSCFILDMKVDPAEGIFDTLRNCAVISKTEGGVGLSVHDVSAAGTYNAETKEPASGLVPLLHTYNSVTQYLELDSKRSGAIAVYLEPWHAEIFEFLELKRQGRRRQKKTVRHLNHALWIPDLFMCRVETDRMWSLFCPKMAPGLPDVSGTEFDILYKKYEDDGRAESVIPACKLWFAILQSQIETGGPYMLYKDAVNAKSNHRHLGTIRSSSLCADIVQYSSIDEVAVCNLASLVLPSFVTPFGFDLQKLHAVVKVLTCNLNRIIDVTCYPVGAAMESSMRHRPIGIGVQGLADTFMALGLPFESPDAKLLNIQMFETIYHGALEASAELARDEGSYSSWEGCPVQNGMLQYDMWGVTPTLLWDWTSLKKKIAGSGLRNSLLTSSVATVSMSRISGFNASVEPYTSNVWSHRILSHESLVMCPSLIRGLVSFGLWNDDMRDAIIANNGSVQSIPTIPNIIKAVYKSVWEINQRTILDLAIDRGPFICQSQSLNVHLPSPTLPQLMGVHFYGWKRGLKTGLYRLRTCSSDQAVDQTDSGVRSNTVDTSGEVIRTKDLSPSQSQDSSDSTSLDSKNELLVSSGESSDAISKIEIGCSVTQEDAKMSPG